MHAFPRERTLRALYQFQSDNQRRRSNSIDEQHGKGRASPNSVRTFGAPSISTKQLLLRPSVRLVLMSAPIAVSKVAQNGGEEDSFPHSQPSVHSFIFTIFYFLLLSPFSRPIFTIYGFTRSAAGDFIEKHV